MSNTPRPPTDNESERLTRLRALRVLDTAPEPLFDALTRSASFVAGVPMALLGLVDGSRHWFKANVGLEEMAETSRDNAFCAHVVREGELLEVADATVDARFAANPLVTGAPHIRFYAGTPITLRDGSRMGTLCVIDRQPHALDDHQRAALMELAKVAAEALEQRAEALDYKSAVEREREAVQLRVEAHARLKNVIEATRAGTWEWNARTGETRINARWAELIGRVMADLEPLSISTFEQHVHADDWPGVLSRLNEHVEGKRDFFDHEFRMLHRDGHWIWIRSRGRFAAWDSDGSPLWMFGTHVDVSERKATERRLHESEAFLDRTGRIARVGGWEIDLATMSMYWTDETFRIHEVSTGQHPTFEEAMSYFPAQSAEHLKTAIRKSVSEGRDWDLEVPLTTATGRQIWVRIVGTVELENSKPKWLIGAIQDVTARKRAVDALEVSERRFRKLFEHSLGLICTHDLDGIILSVNPAAARELGYPLAELMGRPFTDFMPIDAHASFGEYLQRIRTNRIDAGLLYLNTQDGNRLIWQYYNVLDDESGNPYVLGHAQDVTEKQRQERQLRDWSIRDPLTGCYNRRYLAETAAAMRENEVWGCIVIDLDRFKQVNDTHGHDRGDEVLVDMSQFLRRHVRQDDFIVRTGGDEFLILLKNADEQATRETCERMQWDHKEAPIGFTLGHAVRKGNMPLDSVLRVADQRLYEKRAQRSQEAAAIPDESN